MRLMASLDNRTTEGAKHCSAGEKLRPQQIPWVGVVGAVQDGVHGVLLRVGWESSMTHRSQQRCLTGHSCGAGLSKSTGVIDTVAQAVKDATEAPS